MIVSLEQVSKSYGASLVLRDITVKIADRDKIGLIGSNGAGKSTLLNLIAGGLEADEGTLSRSDARIGYLRQDSGLTGTNTIRAEMRSVFAGLLCAEEELRELEKQIASCPQGGGE